MLIMQYHPDKDAINNKNNPELIKFLFDNKNYLLS